VSNDSEKQYEDDRERLLEEIRRRAEEAELKRLDEEEKAQRETAEPPPSIEEPLTPPEVPPPSPPHATPPQYEEPDEVEMEPHELLREAQEFYQNERYEKALALVEKVLDIYPGLGQASKLHDQILRARQLAEIVRKEEARHRATHLEPLPPAPPAQPLSSPDRPESDFWGPTRVPSDKDAMAPGIKESGPAKPPAPPLLDRTVSRLTRVRIPIKPILIASAVLVAAVVIYIVIDNLVNAVVPPQHVLLLLPVSPAGAAETELLLADGLTEDFIQTIGRAPDLRVIAPVSAFNSRTLSVRPQQLARGLKAGFVLTWTLQTAGEKLLCSASLLDTTDDVPLWKLAFETTPAGLASRRIDLARQIVEAMRIELPSVEDPFAPATQPATIRTYGLYLQARGLARSSLPDALPKAKELLQQVVQADSNWGECWAALGWVEMLAMERNPDAPRSEAVSALAYIQRAIARGARFAETFRVWGMIETFNANHLKAIERYENAINLCPGDAEAQQRLALAYTLHGKKEEALNAASAAAQWDPLNPDAITLRGLVQQYQGDFRGAEQSYTRAKQVAREQAERAADLHIDVLVYLQRADDAFLAATDMAARRRDDPLSHYRLGRVAQIAGQPIQEWQNVLRQTLDLIDQRLRTSPEDPEMLVLKALTHTRLGQFKDALEADAQALRVAPENLEVLYGTARMYALQRDQKQAAAFLAQAVDRRYDLARVVDMDFFNIRADQDFLRAVTR
jgi:tetratricopeptide (TPR) repeat protein/TolB-like protein